jgi:hypothetical protein
MSGITEVNVKLEQYQLSSGSIPINPDREFIDRRHRLRTTGCLVLRGFDKNTYERTASNDITNGLHE